MLVRHALACVHSRRITSSFPLIPVLLTVDIKPNNRLHAYITPTNRRNSPITPVIDLTALSNQVHRYNTYFSLLQGILIKVGEHQNGIVCSAQDVELVDKMRTLRLNLP